MIFIFFRKNNGEENWYPLELADDDEARRNAECNPGTTRVEDVRERVVWKKDQDANDVLK